ncbi:unnamed protein product [Rotaria sordida]|uniref:tRNA-dihydrouridine(47) synthase [NAD(P)(+)] n=1 Tax=Rotaria sordida TaxID=392033 RepID=A0A819DLW6_9BILA|nr:unnamed protein product [Rotaria sordida]CAF3836494.1 unnamed protein product [Rotaria sordida]
MMSSNEEIQSSILFQRITHPINERSKLTEEQLNKYETWKIQPGMAQIKLEFIDFDHEVRLSIEHLNEKDKKLIIETNNNETNDSIEPKKKKFKGQNRKHLEINARSSSSNINDHQLCFFVVRGGLENCPYQSNCKHSHDLTSYLSRRPIDLDSYCYMFDVYGKCSYGILCRFGQSHIDSITGHNKNILHLNQNYIESLNKYPPLLKHLLRRKKYDYKLSDHIIKIANKQITKVNIAKRNNPINDDENKINEKQHDNNNDIGEKDDRSLVDIYYSALQIDNNQNQNKPSENEHLQTELDANDGEQQQRQSSRPVPFRTLGVITDVDMIRLKPREKIRIDFNRRLYLAPLTTAGNLPFRRICKEYGCEITCGEMAMTTSLLQGQMSEFALLRRHPSETIFGIQLCGSFVDTMTRTVQLLEENFDYDFIDLNCACPIDLVYKKGAGCALTRRTIDFERICRSVSCLSTHPITIKLRTGIMTGENNAHDIISLAKSWKTEYDENHVIDLFTLHGRSKEMRYSKSADWNYIDECAKLSNPIPLYGVGDIYSFEDYYQRLNETNVSGCMIARGALIKPWLFTEIKEQRTWDISANERFDMLKRYANYGLEHWGSDQAGVDKTRRFLLEWISFLYRYIPVGLLERLPHRLNERPPYFFGRNDLETLMSSKLCSDWVKLTELLLGKVSSDFQFLPKHKANAYG